MNLIPVIDIARGHAVHARGGLRETYQPLQSILCHSSKPLDVMAGLLDLYAFTDVYIADLDAIQGRPVQSAVLRQLHQAFPAVQLWIDAGIRNVDQFRSLQQLVAATLVLGSETLTDVSVLEEAVVHETGVLSLDFRGRFLLGPATLPDTPALWPRRVIAMTLDRVGQNRGPDLNRLRKLHNAAPATALYAAGGVRNRDDLNDVQLAGCAGVLLASALHDGRLTAPGLADFR
ncbi:MAG TPA: hypothetical protein ENK49_12870 [Gammaproteobacteria bacterium]|nr:hypothetical protein [Gammaproteobacteria bacterium]